MLARRLNQSPREYSGRRSVTQHCRPTCPGRCRPTVVVGGCGRHQPLQSGRERRSDGGRKRHEDTQGAPSPGLVNPMRWSIRSQILVPLIAIQAVAVAAIAIATATLAAHRSERQIVDRLNGVIDALGDARFPVYLRRSGPDARAFGCPLRRVRGGRARDSEQPAEPRSAATRASVAPRPRSTSMPWAGIPRPPLTVRVPRGVAAVHRPARRARRSWSSTPRRAGGRRDGRPRCRP